MTKYLKHFIRILTMSAWSLCIEAMDLRIVVPERETTGFEKKGIYHEGIDSYCSEQAEHEGKQSKELPMKTSTKPLEELNLSRLITSQNLTQLKSDKYGIITLDGCWGNEESSSAFLDYYLKISPTVINIHVISLTLHGCGLKSKHIDDIHKFTNLLVLILTSNEIGDEGVTKVTRLTQLQSLDLGLTGVSDKSLPALSHMPCLRYLNLSSNRKVTDTGIQHFYNNTSLESLKINGNSITWDGYEQLKAQRPKLQIDYFPASK